MKTNDVKKRIPGIKKLTLYAIAVAAACFLSCLATQATDYKKFTGSQVKQPLEFLEPRGLFPGSSNLFTFGGLPPIWSVSRPLPEVSPKARISEKSEDWKIQQKVKEHTRKTGER
jgi:hypothetical protein